MSFEPRPFQPTGWAPGPHAQTLLARVLRPSSGPMYERERVETPDGDFLDLDWAPDPGAEAPIVLVLHGLEGSSSRRYVRNVCRELFARGVRAVALNFRGCSGESNRRARFYHSGESGDPRFVLELLRRRYPHRRMGALGFSLGGNVLLKLLGEDPAAATELLQGAVAVSVPYDLAAGSRLLERSRMGRLYTAYFMRMLKEKVRLKREILSPVLDLDAVLRSRTLWEFDEVATAPLNGFEGAAQYYAESSSLGFLGAIEVPTLLIHAEDDPFLPSEAIPRTEASKNPNLHLALHRGGGHVAFLEGTPLRPAFWGDEEGARFLAERVADEAKATR